MRTLKSIIIVLALLVSTVVQAQTITSVRGTISDEMGPLITIEYSCTSPRQAAFLTNAFHTRADRIYQTVTELLTAKGDPADEAGQEE